MTDQDKVQAIAQRNQAMSQNMTLVCPAYLHGFEIDGKTGDFTNPASWGDSIQIRLGGSITTVQDGIKTVVTNALQPTV